MAVTMLYLGLRPGEAAGLAWDDIDVESGTVHVWRSRKIGTSGDAVVGETKTPGSIRTLDALQPVLDDVELYFCPQIGFRQRKFRGSRVCHRSDGAGPSESEK